MEGSEGSVISDLFGMPPKNMYLSGNAPVELWGAPPAL